MHARFVAPVYDGERVAVIAEPVAGGDDEIAVTLAVRNESGVMCATGEARMPARPVELAEFPQPVVGSGPPRESPPTASPETLAPGTVLTLAPYVFDAHRSAAYLADVRDDLALYRDACIAHPGWIVRHANSVLRANVSLGPWIHVESATRHLGLVRDGDCVRTAAVVTREWEHKGHRFVELDVAVSTVDGPVARIRHIAIYRPRPASPAGRPPL